tara:strand:- start:6 stop:497 length:492 start_codon:yes stop_codon:yes gene_type:complete
MKKSELMAAIREVVKEEVSKQTKQLVNEIKKMTAKNINEIRKSKKTIVESPSLNLSDNVPSKNPYEFTGEKRYTENDSLNSILNETANSMKGGEEWPTMNKQAFRADMAQAMGGTMDQMFGQNRTSAMLPNDRKNVEVEPHLEKALTRDYSDLVKAFNLPKGR